jgi:phage repressor protein C with HTH and peptisase S24 domain
VVATPAPPNFQLRLDKVLHQFGSVADLARLIGVSDNAIYKWLSGRGQPSVANLVALAKASKVSVEWLATGQENADVKRPPRRSTDPDDLFYVPRYDQAPTVRGELLRSEQMVDYLAFKKDWVRSRFNADPRNLLLIEVIGDAMAPTLEDSDLMLVDFSEPRFRHDGIYVLRRENELEVKRLQRRPDGTLNIISDNSIYESSIVASDSLHIFGRVIWAGGGL